jgi:hypothetical protein
MKKNILIIIAGIMVFMSSCSKDFLTVNEKNPNSPSVVDPKLVLPAAENAIAYTMNNPRRFEFAYLWHGEWSISAGYSQPTILTQYKLINSSYQNAFREFYLAGENLDAIEKQSTTPQTVYYLAIAKILKAYIFQNLVDCWGDVPYTEAFQTASGNLKPKYDNQQAIYEDLVVQLDAAMNLIQTATIAASIPLATNDIIYAGDMAKWLKFANTLKLRILVHQATMDGRAAYITGKIATTASIGYLGAGEGALSNPPYQVSQGKMNPFYETFYNNAGGAQSDGITYYNAGKDNVDFLIASNDPRIGKYWNPYSGTSYDGNYFGTQVLTPANKTSKLGYVAGDAGTMIGTPTKSAYILTDFESLFIQAEAAQRGLIAGDVQALYESAVKQSFARCGVSSAAAGVFLSQNTDKANFTVAIDKLQLILLQKWVALNGVAPVEVWTDYRRTGIPTFIHFSQDPARSKDYPPVRLLYPQDEINVNNDNVMAVGPIDPWTSKIFWQKR